MNGWIKFSRQLVDSDLYLGEKFDRTHCLLDLMILAQWKEYRSFFKRGIKVELTRGQLAVSAMELSRRWMLSDKTVRKRLDEFEKSGHISIKRSKTINIITINHSYISMDSDSESETCDSMVDTQNTRQNTHLASEPTAECSTQPTAECSTELSLRKEKNRKKDKNTNNAHVREDGGDAGDSFFQAFFAEQRMASIEQLCMSWHITQAEFKTVARECVLEWQITGTDFSEDFSTLSRRLLQHMRAKLKYNREDSIRHPNDNSGRSFGSRNRNQIPGAPEGTVKIVEVDGQKVYLGHDEFIHPDGFRTYCRSGEHVPFAAPPRPGKGWWWQPITNSWCDLP